MRRANSRAGPVVPMLAAIRRRGIRTAALGLGLILACPCGLAAQETRGGIIAAEQARKAQDLHPYEPGRVEQAIQDVRRRLLEERAGVFPVFGSVYPGGGFTMGAGYRYPLGEVSRWEVTGLYSVRNYRQVEGRASTAGLGGRASAGVSAGWRDATQVAFFGLGMSNPVTRRANYRLQQGYLEGRAALRPATWARLAGALSYEDFNRGAGQGRYPEVHELFAADAVPGIDADVTYVHASVTGAVDTRESAEYARRGGYYGITLHDYMDRHDAYSFRRVDVDLVQHIPFRRETWVLSLRGRVQATTSGDAIVPFFLLPSLGGGNTLRAYQSWRYRDRHSILASAEWRWFPNRTAMDMALFYDAGKVTSSRSGIDLTGLRGNMGIGARFHAPNLTVLRLDLAKGSEGWNLVFAGDAAF